MFHVPMLSELLESHLFSLFALFAFFVFLEAVFLEAVFLEAVILEAVILEDVNKAVKQNSPTFVTKKEKLKLCTTM